MVHVWAIRLIVIPLLIWLPFSLLFSMGFLVAETRLAALIVIVGVGALIVAVAYAWAYLYRRFYRWEIGGRELLVWRGILFRKRITIPYMRVQNVNVIRGPLLLLFGLSGVEVETAGQKGAYHSGPYSTEGFLPGIVGGERVADAIIERAKAEKGREGV